METTGSGRNLYAISTSDFRDFSAHMPSEFLCAIARALPADPAFLMRSRGSSGS